MKELVSFSKLSHESGITIENSLIYKSHLE